MKSDNDLAIDVPGLKQAVKGRGVDMKSDADYDALEAELLQKFRAEPIVEVAPVVTEPEPETKDKKHKKVEVKDA